MYKAVSIVAEVESKSIEQLMLYLLNLNTDMMDCLRETEMEM